MTLYHGDALEVLREMPSESANCAVTSPPYWGLRDYGVDGQLGLEATPLEFVARLTGILRELRRVLVDDGTLWLNLGDSYAASKPGRGSRGYADPGWSSETSRKPPPGLKTKDLVGIPWRVAFALQDDGWYLRSDIIWSKPNPMPESVTDRPTKAHEYLFLLSKSHHYYYDAAAIAEPATWFGPNGKMKSGPHAEQKGIAARAGKNEKTGDRRKVGFNERWDARDGAHALTRNKRSVWEVQTVQFAEAHFATFPPALIEPCILAGCPEGGVVLDPFGGSGTTALVARKHGRRSVLIELSETYCELAAARLGQQSLFAQGGAA